MDVGPWRFWQPSGVTRQRCLCMHWCTAPRTRGLRTASWRGTRRQQGCLAQSVVDPEHYLGTITGFQSLSTATCYVLSATHWSDSRRNNVRLPRASRRCGTLCASRFDSQLVQVELTRTRRARVEGDCGPFALRLRAHLARHLVRRNAACLSPAVRWQ